MKFKEGDIVRVMGKYGSYGEEWENVHWVDAMDYTIGEQGHVKKAVEIGGEGDVSFIRWSYNGGTTWNEASIADLIKAYEKEQYESHVGDIYEDGESE